MTTEVSRRRMLSGMAIAAAAVSLPGQASTSMQGVAASAAKRPELPAINVSAIAERMVQTLQPQPDERAVMVFEPTTLARNESKRWPPDPAVLRQKHSEWLRALQPLFNESDIFLWMPADVLSPDRRWEHLIANSRVRSIHFHWLDDLDKLPPEEIRTLSSIYERALLETDYKELSRRQDELIAAIRGHSLRITTASGTDLRIRVPQD